MGQGAKPVAARSARTKRYKGHVSMCSSTTEVFDVKTKLHLISLANLFIIPVSFF